MENYKYANIRDFYNRASSIVNAWVVSMYVLIFMLLISYHLGKHGTL